MATDIWPSSPTVQDAPSGNAELVVSGQSLLTISRGLYIGVGGDVTAVMANGQTVQFKNAASGSVIPIRVQKVTAATTATNIVSLS